MEEILLSIISLNNCSFSHLLVFSCTKRFSTLFPLSMFSIKCLSSRLNHSLRSCSSIIMASRSDNEMAEPAEKKIRLESFLDDCVASIQPSQIIRPSSPSEVNLNFAGLSITEKLKTSGPGVFGYSGGWSSSPSTLSWGHGRPTSFDHQERSPGAGRENGRQLLRSPPPSEKYEVEPDLRSSTSSDDGYQARAPTPERFNRYSLRKTWPQPAELFCKDAALAALEVQELNLGRLFINDLNQLREQYERELAQLRRSTMDQLKQREEEDKKNLLE